MTLHSLLEVARLRGHLARLRRKYGAEQALKLLACAAAAELKIKEKQP